MKKEKELHPLAIQLMPFFKDENFGKRELAVMVSDAIESAVKEEREKPISLTVNSKVSTHDPEVTLLDKFAMQALNGLIQGFERRQLQHVAQYGQGIASLAYSLAQYMLKQKSAIELMERAYSEENFDKD